MASRASSFTRAQGVEEGLAAHGEAVGVARRDELAVVREGALDEAGGEAHVAHLEGGVALAQAQGDRLGGAEQPGELVQGARGHQHGLALAQHVDARQVAHGQAVGVGGHQAQAVALGGHEHAGDDGSRVVVAGRPHHLAEGVGQGSCVQGDLVGRGLGQPGEVVGGQEPHPELRATGADAGLLLTGVELHAPGLEGPHDVGGQARRDDAHAVLLAPDGHLHLDGQVEVAARQAQAIPPQLGPHPREHGERPTTGGHGPAGRGQRFHQDVTLAPELHVLPLSY